MVKPMPDFIIQGSICLILEFLDFMQFLCFKKEPISWNILQIRCLLGKVNVSNFLASPLSYDLHCSVFYWQCPLCNKKSSFEKILKKRFCLRCLLLWLDWHQESLCQNHHHSFSNKFIKAKNWVNNYVLGRFLRLERWIKVWIHKLAQWWNHIQRQYLKKYILFFEGHTKKIR